ncbi:MAG: SDR family oxidoreductase [Halobacteria archaeon]
MARSVLITGCSSGIGRKTAVLFADKGWNVYASSRNPEDIEDLEGIAEETLELDVTDQDEVDRAVETVRENEGGVDSLVNNAGIGIMGAVEDVTTEELEKQMEVNLYGPHRMIRAVLPGMRERGKGRIINMSSISGRVSTPGMGAYVASKHALEGLTDALRTEVQEFGIDAVLIEPGPVKTKFTDNADMEFDLDGPYGKLYRSMEDTTEEMFENKFSVTPDKIAKTVVKAAEARNPKARYTGAVQFRALRSAEHLPAKVQDWMYGKMMD